MAAVTVAMPIYNGEAYLDSAIASICAQTFKDIEILISDNSSTDKTPDIIAAWKERDPRIRSYRQGENIGARKNYEWLLLNAKSPWFMFADYDDKWSPNYIEALYKIANETPGTGLAVSAMKIVNLAGEEQRTKLFCVNNFKGASRVRFSLKTVRFNWIYGLARRDQFLRAWQEMSRYKSVWGHDMIVILPFIFSGSVAGTNEATFYFRDTGISAKRYHPKNLAGEAELYFSFLSEELRIMKESPLNRLQQASLFFNVVLYTGRHGWKLRRLLRHAALYCVGLYK
jgi:glycosyltransferase involved in cell wall biosynthesis